MGRMSAAGLLVMLLACGPTEIQPPEAVRGSWQGSCRTSPAADALVLDVHLEIAAETAPVLRLGGASLVRGRYLDCAGFAVEQCDVVLDGELEGTLDASLEPSYNLLTAFVWKSGTVLTMDAMAMENLAILAAEFSCQSSDLTPP